MLALSMAPAIVRASSIMRVVAPSIIIVRSNTILTPAMITREALRILEQELTAFSTLPYEESDYFWGEPFKAHINIRRPVRFAGLPT